MYIINDETRLAPLLMTQDTATVELPLVQVLHHVTRHLADGSRARSTYRKTPMARPSSLNPANSTTILGVCIAAPLCPSLCQAVLNP